MHHLYLKSKLTNWTRTCIKQIDAGDGHQTTVGQSKKKNHNETIQK